MTPEQKATHTALAGITRRQFFEGVAVVGAGAAAIVGTMRVEEAATAGRVGTAFTRLTEREGRLLTAVLDRLIPPDGVMPGAGEMQIAHFIDRLMADAPHISAPVRQVLKSASPTEGGVPSPVRLDERLRAIERDDPQSFTALLQAAYAGYYGHPDVLEKLGWTELHTRAEPFDVRLVEAVRRRGALYREA